MKPVRQYRCRGCGGSYSSAHRVCYCEACWTAIVTKNIRARSKCGACDGATKCDVCARILRDIRSAASKRGAKTRRNADPNWGPSPGVDTRWRQAAHAAVRKAIARGDLVSLKDGKTKCADCKKPAQEYDHRDYGLPLWVAPVCRSCNLKRGTAKYPFESFKARVNRATP